MKREEIERLLAEYASDEISPADMQLLEECFKQQPELKKEANQMHAVWQMMGDPAESKPMSDETDKAFYTMLQSAKAQIKAKPGRVIRIHTGWLKAAGAIAACLLAFVIGRFTVNTPPAIIQYKTVYVKQPVPVQQPILQPTRTTASGIAAVAKPGIKPKADRVNPALVQQLRSVYASERMTAVMKLADSTKLNTANLDLLALALNEDPNPNVRLTIINALRPISARPKVQQVLISALGKQDDTIIQSSIVDLLINAKSKQAIPEMIVLLDDKNTDAMVQNKIKGGIESLLY
jgi:hypothetical protein